MPLKYNVSHYKQKGQKYFWLPDHELAENLVLVFGLYERTKKE